MLLCISDIGLAYYYRKLFSAAVGLTGAYRGKGTLPQLVTRHAPHSNSHLISNAI
jgi:hypothetical protein